ncbi:peptidylprolyl isomerase [Planosporangium sp. 12N6]|uniref:peptidylprolyl isomerase n=1 Tax=Planosporangium spinosum TaxID=3402278 RepID=UPI003CF9B5F2
MAPSKDRQRALARAKLERQIARRAAAARRRRQVQASIAAGLAVVVVVIGIVWAVGGFDRDNKSKTSAAEDCAWTPLPADSNVKDVGKPPTTGIAKTGTATMTITTNQGVIEAELDRAGAPCTVASFAHLAGKQFFNDTKCHRLTTEGIYVLQCGDPTATGSGGPSYKFPDEKLPTPQPSASGDTPSANLYPAGTLAMANSGPNTNGSQFFVVYKDGSSLEAKYTVFGKVTKGLDLVQQVAAAGVNPKSSATDGEPKSEVKIQSLTVADGPAAAPATPTPSASVPAPSAS